MPIWLRRFTFNSIKEHFDAEREAYNKKNNEFEVNAPKKQVHKPDVQKPSVSYNAKAPK